MKKALWILLILDLFLTVKAFSQVVINHPQDRIPISVVQMVGIDSAYIDQDEYLVITKTNGQSVTAGQVSKPSPYCLCRGYEGKTFSQLGKSQTWIDANYPGLGLSPSDTRMLGEFLKCLYNNDKPISVFDDGALNRGVEIPQYREALRIEFNGHRIDFVGAGVMFYSPKPQTLTEAVNMAYRRFEFRDGRFFGNHQSTAFEVGAGYGHIFWGNEYQDFRVANRQEFGMQTTEFHPRYFNCDTGTVLGGYTHQSVLVGLTQSNKSQVITPRCHGSGSVGVALYGVEGCTVQDPVLEGNTLNRPIDFDDRNQSDVKTFFVNYPYQEFTQGIGDAYIRLKMKDGIFVLTGGIGHGAGLLIDAKESGSSTDIIVQYLGFWLGNSGKLFDTKTNGPSWTFLACRFAHSNNYQQLQNFFVVPSMVSYCPENTNCGYGKYTALTAPR